MSWRLSLYTKRHCPLCDGAAAVLRRLSPEFGLAVEEVDIEGQPVLWWALVCSVLGDDGAPAAASRRRSLCHLGEFWSARGKAPS